MSDFDDNENREEKTVYELYFRFEDRYYSLGIFTTIDKARKAFDKIYEDPEKYIAPDNWDDIKVNEIELDKLNPVRIIYKFFPKKKQS